MSGASVHTALVDVLKATATLSSIREPEHADRAARLAIDLARLDTTYWRRPVRVVLEHACESTAYLLNRDGRVTHVEAAWALAATLPYCKEVSDDV